MNHRRMGASRWVAGCLLVACACGRTAKDGAQREASAGAPAITSGGSGSQAGSSATAGSEPTAGAAECPLTPASGQWVGRGPDPYGLELWEDGSQLAGQACLGGLPGRGELLLCAPIVLQQDRGRSVDFVWDMSQGTGAGIGLAYAAQMKLTLSPERDAMAGTVWTSLAGTLGDPGTGQEMIFVRYPDQALPSPTACSGGEPSGECFRGPLRADHAGQSSVVGFGDADVLIVWQSQRAYQRRLAGARFDGASGAWQTPRFLDDGSGPVTASALAASHGSAVVAYEQEGAILARLYDRKTDAWSSSAILAEAGPGQSDSSSLTRVASYDNGDATVVATTLSESDGATIVVRDYDATSETWKEPSLKAPSESLDGALASEGGGKALLLWARGAGDGEPYELWFSVRSVDGSWSEPASFHRTDAQLLRPALAIDHEGNVIATWQEFLGRIASSTYSFESGSWSEPLTVSSAPHLDNGPLFVAGEGTLFAYVYSNDLAQFQKSALQAGGWGALQEAPAGEVTSAVLVTQLSTAGLVVTQPHGGAGPSLPPPLALGRCEGY